MRPGPPMRPKRRRSPLPTTSGARPAGAPSTTGPARFHGPRARLQGRRQPRAGLRQSARSPVTTTRPRESISATSGVEPGHPFLHRVRCRGPRTGDPQRAGSDPGGARTGPGGGDPVGLLQPALRLAQPPIEAPADGSAGRRPGRLDRDPFRGHGPRPRGAVGGHNADCARSAIASSSCRAISGRTSCPSAPSTRFSLRPSRGWPYRRASSRRADLRAALARSVDPSDRRCTIRERRLRGARYAALWGCVVSTGASDRRTRAEVGLQAS